MEMHLTKLRFNVVSIKSHHSQIECQRMVDNFNRPNSGVQIKLLGIRLGSVLINLQFGAHRTIIMKWFKSVQAFLQAVQKHEQWISITWIDQSYDQLPMRRICEKFVSSLGRKRDMNLIKGDIKD